MVKRQGKGKGKGRERGGDTEHNGKFGQHREEKGPLTFDRLFFGIFNGGERHSSVYGRPGDGY